MPLELKCHVYRYDITSRSAVFLSCWRFLNISTASLWKPTTSVFCLMFLLSVSKTNRQTNRWTARTHRQTDRCIIQHGSNDMSNSKQQEQLVWQLQLTPMAATTTTWKPPGSQRIPNVTVMQTVGFCTNPFDKCCCPCCWLWTALESFINYITLELHSLQLYCKACSRVKVEFRCFPLTIFIPWSCC